MSRLILESQGTGVSVKDQTQEEYNNWLWYMLPLLFAFAVDFMSPQLIAWRILPRAVLWLSDLAIMAMIILVIMRMLVLDNIPKTFLIVLAATIIGVTVALFEGQSFEVTLYGWRRLFQYPLVGLYVYMMPQWPPKSATWIMRIALIALGFNTAVQLALYASGEKPSDTLAGMFGIHAGAGQLIMFVLLVISFGLGRWLARGDWRYLVVALFLGAIASALGSMKLFPVATLSLALVAAVMHLIRAKHILRLAKMIAVLGIGFAIFVPVFNLAAGDISGRQIQDYLDPAVLSNYVGGYDSSVVGVYKLGRNSEPLYIWQSNLQSSTTFLFGRGIGSRAESATLGIAGTFNDTSRYSAGTGKSLPVFLQETGVLGLAALGMFCVAIVVAAYKRAGLNGDTDMAAIQYGLLVFTVLWPLWLWYQPIWSQAIPMLLYWTSIGFALSPLNNQAVQASMEPVEQ